MAVMRRLWAVWFVLIFLGALAEAADWFSFAPKEKDQVEKADLLEKKKLKKVGLLTRKNMTILLIKLGS